MNVWNSCYEKTQPPKYPNYFQSPSKLFPNKQKEDVSFILFYMIPQILNSKRSKLRESKQGLFLYVPIWSSLKVHVSPPYFTGSSMTLCFIQPDFLTTKGHRISLHVSNIDLNSACLPSPSCLSLTLYV